MNDLLGLSEFCGLLNLGGLLKIEYIPINWIDPETFEPIITRSGYNWQTDITINTNDWMTAYVIPDKRIWQENQQQNKQGDFFNQVVRAIVPSLRPSASGELNKMKNYLYLLRITDRNNQKWLLGSPEHPFQFFSEGSTGNTGELNNYAIRFAASSPYRATGFEPVFNT